MRQSLYISLNSGIVLGSYYCSSTQRYYFCVDCAAFCVILSKFLRQSTAGDKRKHLQHAGLWAMWHWVIQMPLTLNCFNSASTLSKFSHHLMVNLHDFLVKNAKFPFPRPDEHGSIISADISPVEVGKLDSEWKANYAVRDEALVQKLCNGLENILGDSLITTRPKTILLMKFSPLLGSVGTGVLQDREWRRNPNEAHVSFSIHHSKGPMQLSYPLQQSRALLDKGFFEAARIFLAVYGDQNFETFRENSVEGGSSSVDYILVVDDNEVALCEAKSPSVMYHVGQILPEHGIKLTWLPSKSLLRKILSKVSTPLL